MATFKITVEGADRLKAKLASLVPAIRQAVKEEMYQFGEEVMSESKSQYVPVDTGALMNTGHVQPPVEDGDRISVTLGYGDEAVGYALKVHENLSPSVHWKRPGSGPKYLERPFQEKQGELPGRLAAKVR